VIDARSLLEAPAPLANRVARLALQRAGADARRLAARHVRALVDLAGDPGGRELHLPNRIRAWRDKRRRILLRGGKTKE